MKKKKTSNQAQEQKTKLSLKHFLFILLEIPE